MFIHYERPADLDTTELDPQAPTSDVARKSDQCGAALTIDNRDWCCTRDRQHDPKQHHAHFGRNGDGPLDAVGAAWDPDDTGLWLNFTANDRSTVRAALVNALCRIDAGTNPNELIGDMVGGGPGGDDSGVFCDEATVRMALLE